MLHLHCFFPFFCRHYCSHSHGDPLCEDRASLFLPSVPPLIRWAMLGLLGVCITEQPRDAYHLISFVERRQFPLKTPLRWHGHLRDESTRLPWVYGYEIELSGVEVEGALQPARGRLRLSLGIISVGEDNPCGHPRPELLEGLENTGMRVVRTDRDGAPQVLPDGTRLEITCFVACPGVINTALSVHGETDPPDHHQNQEKK